MCKERILYKIWTLRDEDMTRTRRWSVDPLEVPIEPITRARAKRFKEALNGLIQELQRKEDLNYTKEEPSFIQIIKVAQGEDNGIKGAQEQKDFEGAPPALNGKGHP